MFQREEWKARSSLSQGDLLQALASQVKEFLKEMGTKDLFEKGKVHLQVGM